MIAAACVAGCTSTEYLKYAEAQRAVGVEQARAEQQRYAAMAEIAKTGDGTTKVAAMFALQGGAGQQHNQVATMLAPKSGWDTAKEWVGLILPTAVQAYGINANKQVAIAQSNNSKDIAVSTNQTFSSMAGNIATAGANGGTAVSNVATAGFAANQAVATAGLTAVQTTATTIAGQGFDASQVLGAAGITGVQATAEAGLTATQTTATAGLTAVQTTAQSGLTATQTTATNAITALTNGTKVCSVDPATSVLTCNP